LRDVAADDLGLYSAALHAQAMLLGAGELELHLFNSVTRGILLHILELGQLEMSDSRVQKGSTSAPQDKAGVAAYQSDSLKPVGPVIIQGTQQVQTLLSLYLHWQA
jgi:hypothetical protein